MLYLHPISIAQGYLTPSPRTLRNPEAPYHFHVLPLGHSLPLLQFLKGNAKLTWLLHSQHPDLRNVCEWHFLEGCCPWIFADGRGWMEKGSNTVSGETVKTSWRAAFIAQAPRAQGRGALAPQETTPPVLAWINWSALFSKLAQTLSWNQQHDSKHLQSFIYGSKIE